MFGIKSKLNIEHITPDLYVTYLVKYIYQNFFLQSRDNHQSLFIIGCQRSGTSLINRVFARDLNVRVYRESSRLSSNDPSPIAKNKLRLNSFNEMKATLDKDKAPIIVFKPLVETQNTLEILDFFPEAKALWMYRHYKDVVNSLLKKFSVNVGIRNLKSIVENNQENWYSEKVPENIRRVVIQHFSEQMSPYDAAALFWFVRNQLFYELQLDSNPRALMCRYEDLVTQPDQVMHCIYEFIGAQYNDKNSWEVHSNSVKKGHLVQLSPVIEQLCDDLLRKLENTYNNQNVLQRKPVEMLHQ
ncbi:sulfotransferase [Acaryochloris sp. IP29b_bin.148]|uniref:sulfotransferase family protein n=1 Tax=Acaryochloris sp. IP29b_bin.148 TaxID=2969218 RepID=UPI0026066255|nr:sulfotransferase [Acaryochloris sp. IP29b_bin.148]